MTNTTGMVILAGIALLGGGIKIMRGDYAVGGIDRPMRCSDLGTPAGQKYQVEAARKSIVQGKQILAQLQAENAKYPPGTIVNLRSCNGSVQSMTVPPGGIHAKQVAECQAKLLMAQRYYDSLHQGQNVKVRTSAPPQLVQNQVPPRPTSGPIVSKPSPKLGANHAPAGH